MSAISATKTFNFLHDQLTEHFSARIEYAQLHPIQFTVSVLILVISYVPGLGVAGMITSVLLAAWQAWNGSFSAESFVTPSYKRGVSHQLVAAGGVFAVLGTALMAAGLWTQFADPTGGEYSAPAEDEGEWMGSKAWKLTEEGIRAEDWEKLAKKG